MALFKQTLENDLVRLTPLVQEDFEELLNVASDPNIWKYHPSNDRFKKEVFIDFFKGALNSVGPFVIWDKSTDRIIGSSRFNTINNRDDIIEIGWSFLAVSYWGVGYNLAFKKLMIDYALNHFTDILFYVDTTNIISQKAMANLGAKKYEPQGTEHIPAKRESTLIYVINKDNWSH